MRLIMQNTHSMIKNQDVNFVLRLCNKLFSINNTIPII